MYILTTQIFIFVKADIKSRHFSEYLICSRIGTAAYTRVIPNIHYFSFKLVLSNSNGKSIGNYLMLAQ